MACICCGCKAARASSKRSIPSRATPTAARRRRSRPRVAGIEITENLPQTAKAMNDVVPHPLDDQQGRAAIRGRRYLLHTGYLPTASVKYPTLGSIVAQEIGDPASRAAELRPDRGQSRSTTGGGLLGRRVRSVRHAQRPAGRRRTRRSTTTRPRYHAPAGPARASWRPTMPTSGGKQEVADHQKLYAKAAAHDPQPARWTASTSTKEPQKIRDAYGSAPVRPRLPARPPAGRDGRDVRRSRARQLGHAPRQLQPQSKTLCGQLDQPFAALLADLKQRGMLDNTLVVWMGEFGRTPRINPTRRPRPLSAGLQRGPGRRRREGRPGDRQDRRRRRRRDRPPGRRAPTCSKRSATRLKIDPDNENMSSIGRPIKIVDGGEVVKEVFG